MVCRNACANDTSPSYVVALEPLIHWGTVTPATEVPLAHGRILAFLRNSERCDDPLWTMAIQAFMPEHRMIYCSNCLEILIERRQEGFVPIKECKMNGFMPVNSHQVNQTTANRRVLGRWHTGMAESEARRSMTSGSELFEGYENENEKASMVSQILVVLICLLVCLLMQWHCEGDINFANCKFMCTLVRWNRLELLQTAGPAPACWKVAFADTVTAQCLLLIGSSAA
jgi:hypothetical protein